MKIATLLWSILSCLCARNNQEEQQPIAYQHLTVIVPSNESPLQYPRSHSIDIPHSPRQHRRRINYDNDILLPMSPPHARRIPPHHAS